jgi:uncharacterized repeat protein (TIGR03803 family)
MDWWPDMTTVITTLVTFNNIDGSNPMYEGLITDANGDLFGTTAVGGASGYGTVFEIAKTNTGYASAPTTLVSFNIGNGEEPVGSLIADANGDLFGTTTGGGASGYGTVFEIAKTDTGYASAPATLVSFNSGNGANPYSGLIADANGDLFGTTEARGASGYGTVFEIAKTNTGYASAPITLVSFNNGNGANPIGSLIADANGDLFGTTEDGGASGDGTVFEIAKTNTGYASAPTTLVSFNGFGNGSLPFGSLIADANGDLFGTTIQGGPGGYGTVFEIAKTSTGYASALTTLVSFNVGNGASPYGGLIADAYGDLFGTTQQGGSSGYGTVFEIAKIDTGYASVPTTLVSFNNGNGTYPIGSLIADANGDLFGTIQEDGASRDGTVFEITGSGFVTAGEQAALSLTVGNTDIGAATASAVPFTIGRA